MKLTIDSTNIALWAEGQLTSFSQHTLKEFERTDPTYHKYMKSIEPSPKALFEAIFSDDFPFDDQIKLLSILNVHAMTFTHMLDVHPVWQKTLKAVKAVLGMRKIIPGTFRFEQFGIHEQTQARTFEMPSDPHEYVRVHEDNNILAMVVGISFYIDEHRDSLPDEFIQYELLGRMGYHYAKNARDLIDWNAACILTSIVGHSSSPFKEINDLLRMITEEKPSAE